MAPHYRDFAREDGDPLRFVIVKNLSRRHLDEGQRAMVAVKAATMRQGERTDLGEPSANLRKVSQTEAAAMVNVSRRSLQSAKTVAERGVSELAAAVEDGALPVSVAAQAAALPEDEQRRIAIRARTGDVPGAKRRLAEPASRGDALRYARRNRGQACLSG